MPVVIIPLLASIFASGLMVMLLGGPIASLMAALTAWLSSLTGTGAVLLGLLLGTMMAFDLGGPINKVAYGFAVAGLGAGSPENPSAPRSSRRARSRSRRPTRSASSRRRSLARQRPVRSRWRWA